MSDRVPPQPQLAAPTLLIDWQEEYRTGILLDGVEMAIARRPSPCARPQRGARVVARAGAAAMLIARTRARFVAELRPLPARWVEEIWPRRHSPARTSPCSAVATPLVVMGAMTHMRLVDPARRGGSLRLDPSAMPAPRDLPLPGGGSSRPASHEANLAALGDRFARVVQAADLR
jgi:hypothetical protein